MSSKLHNLASRLNIDKDLLGSYGRYLPALYGGYKKSKLFQDVETFCLFIGYPRSGHSLVGSLLDAHPRMVIAHELDALRFVRRGFSRNQLYHLILTRDRTFTKAGRKWSGYEYIVPNQWQGRFEKISVIGDKKGSGSTKALQRRPELLDQLRKTVGVKTRFVHVTRNPYDNISTMSRRHNKPLETSISYYFSLCKTIADVKRRIDPHEMLDVRHEAVIEDPRSSLKELCAFLGTNYTDAYLDDCAGIVFPAPNKSRNAAPWDDALIRRVASEMEAFDFLHGYSFDN